MAAAFGKLLLSPEDSFIAFLVHTDIVLVRNIAVDVIIQKLAFLFVFKLSFFF